MHPVARKVGADPHDREAAVAAPLGGGGQESGAQSLAAMPGRHDETADFCVRVCLDDALDMHVDEADEAAPDLGDQEGAFGVVEESQPIRDLRGRGRVAEFAAETGKSPAVGRGRRPDVRASVVHAR